MRISQLSYSRLHDGELHFPAVATEIDPNVKAIVSSGYRDSDVMLDITVIYSGSYGFTGRISKPYKAQELRELLDQVLKR